MRILSLFHPYDVAKVMDKSCFDINRAITKIFVLLYSRVVTYKYDYRFKIVILPSKESYLSGFKYLNFRNFIQNSRRINLLFYKLVFESENQ